MSQTDCVIVGGGVIGLSVAWELAKRDMSVTVLERDSLGKGTSWAGVGILPPANEQFAEDPIEKLRATSHRLHRQWHDELLRLTGVDNGYRNCGGIYFARTAGEMASLVGWADYCAETGIAAERLSMADLNQMIPGMRIQNSATRVTAYFLPDEAQIRSPDHLIALQRACEMGGVEIREQVTVTGLSQSQGQLDYVHTDRGPIHADQFCFAGGAWTSGLLDSVGLSIEVFPVRGQVLLYKFSSPKLRHVLNEGNRYLVSRDDGHLLIGSNEEEVGFEFGTTHNVLSSLQSWGSEIFPELATILPEKSWSGLRPGTFDGFPYIGRLPDVNNGFVATGHYRSGLHLSCATATALAEVMTGNESSSDLSYFSPSRGRTITRHT